MTSTLINICTCIANHLSFYGITVNLEKDDYYCPTKFYDMKLSLVLPSGNDPIFDAYMLLSYPGSSNFPQEIISFIKKVEKRKDYFSFNKIKDFKLGYPLFKVPSTYFSTSPDPNPLTLALRK